MPDRLIYLSHPQVQIDPAVPVPDWPLNDIGQARVDALARVALDRLASIRAVVSSPERKARDTADTLAAALGLPVDIAEDSYENDRSATGFLPGPEFEQVADAFFAAPGESVRGWERAIDAQTRITTCVKHFVSTAASGDILMIGHGAVGTLLFCAARSVEINRKYDQGPGGGGNVLQFDRHTLSTRTGWTPMETFFSL